MVEGQCEGGAYALRVPATVGGSLVCKWAPLLRRRRKVTLVVCEQRRLFSQVDKLWCSV